MSYVYVIKNDEVLYKEPLEGANSTKQQLGSLYRKYGTNRIFIRVPNSQGSKWYWQRVEMVWNKGCTQVKHAKLFRIRVIELPKILQMMELTGAV